MEFFTHWGYFGIFLWLLAAGFGFPTPEELPVLTAGILVGHADTGLRWYIMLPICILGVVIGDGVLYGAGRLFGQRILNNPWFQRRILPPDKQAKLRSEFHKRGIWVLLSARLLPGIRSPVFIMAGVVRFPFYSFVIADGIYAIPGVSLLFWTAYMLTDQVLDVFKKVNEYQSLATVVVLSFLAGILVYKYIFSRRIATGEPVHVPEIMKRPAEAMAHMVEHLTHRHHDATAPREAITPPSKEAAPPLAQPLDPPPTDGRAAEQPASHSQVPG